MKKIALYVLVIAAAIGGAAFAYLKLNDRPIPPVDLNS